LAYINLKTAANNQVCRATTPLSIPPNINKNTRTPTKQHNNNNSESKNKKKPTAAEKEAEKHQGNNS